MISSTSDKVKRFKIPITWYKKFLKNMELPAYLTTFSAQYTTLLNKETRDFTSLSCVPSGDQYAIPPYFENV